MRGDPRLGAFAVDVRALMQRSVASLYSHLVTRPTGRAVREAIERQLDELRGPVLSLVDFSAVEILDYSCADEVVAKLLLRYADGTPSGGPASRACAPLFVLKGVHDHHRQPIEAVLERHTLAVVAETPGARFDLLGSLTADERGLWERVEHRGRITPKQVPDVLAGSDPSGLDRLTRRGLVFQDPLAGEIHALSLLIEATGEAERDPPGNR